MYRMELALIMYLSDNDYHARFIRVFYLLTLWCMELAVIMYFCEKHVPARFMPFISEKPILTLKCFQNVKVHIFQKADL